MQENVLQENDRLNNKDYPVLIEKEGVTEISWTINEDERIKVENGLWKWNLICAILHLIQAVAIVILGTSTSAKDFKLPLTTLFLNWDDQKPKQELITQGFLQFAPIASIFSWLSSAAHFIIIIFFKTYIADLRKGINKFRWYEYALSSSVMIALIAMLFGMYDIISLILLMSVNACMNLFGFAMELQNQSTKRTDWTSFYFGCFAGLIPWVCIFAYLGSSGNLEQVPGFVWGILSSYIIMFNTFPVNMVLQYGRFSKWSDDRWGFKMGGYYFGEKVYQILSLFAKSLLIWLVYGGTNQPNAYSDNSTPGNSTLLYLQ